MESPEGEIFGESGRLNVKRTRSFSIISTYYYFWSQNVRNWLRSGEFASWTGQCMRSGLVDDQHGGEIPSGLVR